MERREAAKTHPCGEGQDDAPNSLENAQNCWRFLDLLGRFKMENPFKPNKQVVKECIKEWVRLGKKHPEVETVRSKRKSCHKRHQTLKRKCGAFRQPAKLKAASRAAKRVKGLTKYSGNAKCVKSKTTTNTKKGRMARKSHPTKKRKSGAHGKSKVKAKTTKK